MDGVGQGKSIAQAHAEACLRSRKVLIACVARKRPLVGVWMAASVMLSWWVDTLDSDIRER